jgi:hypothetical protein
MIKQLLELSLVALEQVNVAGEAENETGSAGGNANEVDNVDFVLVFTG